MLRNIRATMQRRRWLAGRPEWLLRDIGIEPAETERWSPLPAPPPGRPDAVRFLTMAPLRS